TGHRLSAATRLSSTVIKSIWLSSVHNAITPLGNCAMSLMRCPIQIGSEYRTRPFSSRSRKIDCAFREDTRRSPFHLSLNPSISIRFETAIDGTQAKTGDEYPVCRPMVLVSSQLYFPYSVPNVTLGQP